MKIKLDLSLLHEARQLGNAEIVHELNNTIQIYKSGIEQLNKTKFIPELKNKIMDNVLSAECKLRCFVLNKRMEKYGKRL